MRRTLILLAALLLATLPLPAQKKQPANAPAKPPAAAVAQKPGLDASFDTFMAESLKEWKVPGAAVAVVHDGKIILSKGYGLRDVESNKPVTPQTLFAIGSITKSFTASLLGMLADEGKLDLDKPVRDYLPDFRLQDPVLTDRVTPRDLLTHRTGLPRHDLLWYGSALSRRQIYERLRYLEASKDLRQNFQYNNLMFMTAGMLAGHLSGKSWEQLARERLFTPLGMESSNFLVDETQKRADFASPYNKLKDEVKKVPFRNLDAVGPAGSINSNVEEMIRYVMFHLGEGKYNDKQLLSKAFSEQMQSVQMTDGAPRLWEETIPGGYGLGLGVGWYRGRKVVGHGGGIDGFTSALSFMPKEKIGVIVLTNLAGHPMNAAVVNMIYDRLLGVEPAPWNQRFAERVKKQRDAAEETRKKEVSSRREGTRPSHDLKEYSGSYEHPAYGTLDVALDGERLKLNYNVLRGALEHFHYDLFETAPFESDPDQRVKLKFDTDQRGNIASVAIKLEAAGNDLVFQRAGEKKMKEKAFLEAFPGEYEFAPGVTAKVELRADNVLTFFVPGQPLYELVPVKDTTFDIKGLKGYSIEFRKEASGAVTEVISHQPNGSFTAKKK